MEKNKEIYGYSRLAQLVPVSLALELFLFGFLFYAYAPFDFRSESFSSLPFFHGFRLSIFLIAILFSAWIFRFFFQLRSTFKLGDDALIVRTKMSETSFAYDLIDSIDYETMLSQGRKLFGSVVLHMKPSGMVRIYNLLQDGEQFIEEFTNKVAGEPFKRGDLRMWLDVRNVDRKMGRARLYIRLWYYPMILALIAFIMYGYLT